MIIFVLKAYAVRASTRIEAAAQLKDSCKSLNVFTMSAFFLPLMSCLEAKRSERGRTTQFTFLAASDFNNIDDIN